MSGTLPVARSTSADAERQAVIAQRDLVHAPSIGVGPTVSLPVAAVPELIGTSLPAAFDNEGIVASSGLKGIAAGSDRTSSSMIRPNVGCNLSVVAGKFWLANE